MTIMTCVLLMLMTSSGVLSNPMYDIFLNPYEMPNGFHPEIWATTLVKSRVLLFVGAGVLFLIGLLNLQKREKFV